jgi:hypothetical protein
MTYAHIYQNSYIVAITLFIILLVLFYIFEIGSRKEIVDGEVKTKLNWQWPLAISLVVWLLWHFYLFPPEGTSVGWTSPPKKEISNPIFEPELSIRGGASLPTNSMPTPEQQFQKANNFIVQNKINPAPPIGTFATVKPDPFGVLKMKF